MGVIPSDFILPADDERDIWYVNRMLVLLRPRQPFVDWLNSTLDPDEAPHTLDEIEGSPGAFLIPIFEYREEAEEWIRENHILIFETHLWDWLDRPQEWPADRSWEVFLEWFDVELLGAPWDVVAAPLHSNPPPREDGWN